MTRPSRTTRHTITLLACALLTACAKPPPAQPDDICRIFKERSTWLSAALATEKRWRIPASVIMAFVHQESSFVSDARPLKKKDKILWFIPANEYQSSAYGYAQALDGTWEDYKKEADRSFAMRTDFRDAVDFIGWYNDKSARTLGISRHDAYRLYLAYHEGLSGYRNQSYKKKPWLIKVAKKVDRRKKQYAGQLRRCAHRLNAPWYIPNIYL